MSVPSNRRRFISEISMIQDYVEIFPQQVHGDRVIYVDAAEITDNLTGTDGIIFRLTQSGHYLLGVLTADCLPVLVYDNTNRFFSVVHAGWKGSGMNIGIKAIKIMTELGSKTANIKVIIGPHIGPCCYRVDHNRKKLFNKFDPNPMPIHISDDFIPLDLGLINVNQMLSVGISKKNMDISSICTSCGGEFYSYRRRNCQEEARSMAFYLF